jgi:hypothetical protein
MDGEPVVIMRGGCVARVGYTAQVGTVTPSSRTPMPLDAIFRTYSMTKLITSAGRAAGRARSRPGRAAMALGRQFGRDPAWWDAQWHRYGGLLRIVLILTAIALAGLVLGR